jgi:hypothetical protein
MSDAGLVLEWPLWGLRIDRVPDDSDQQIAFGGALLYQPTWVQWEETEKGDVVQEYVGDQISAERLGLPVHSQPPVCIVRLGQIDGSGEPEPPITEHNDQVRALVAALRLYSAGKFVDPEETGIYVTFPHWVDRQVRVFRSAFYRVEPEHPYVVGSGDAEALDGLAHWVDICRHDPAHTNVALAIESFCLSFGSAMSSGERALHRFVALEAILGSVHGASFAVRAAHATSGDPEASRWLVHAGDLRNRLAHDLHAVVLADDDLEILEDVTRAVLVAYLAHVARGGVAVADARHPLRSFKRALAAGPIEERHER